MTYSDKLKDPRWQKRRLEIMERDGWACVHCRVKTETLHVHHRWYDHGKEPWEAEDDALVTLCDSCHADEESTADDCRKSHRMLLSIGFSNAQVFEIVRSIAFCASNGTAREMDREVLTRFVTWMFDYGSSDDVGRTMGRASWKMFRESVPQVESK